MISLLGLALVLFTGPAAAAEPIKIGVVWPITGPLSASGSYMVNGAKIAMDKINKDGGVLGRPIKLLIEDGANDPATSVSAAEKLITREKVPVFIGCWGSSPTLAVSASVTKKYKVPHVATTASSGKVTMQDGKRPNPWLFRISPTSRMEAEGVEKSLPKMGVTKVSFLAVNNDWGRGAADEFAKVVKRSGGEVKLTEIIDQGATDFLTQLTKIKASGSNAVIITTSMAQVSLILKQINQLGIKLIVLTTGGGVVPEGLVELAGSEAAEGVFINCFFAPWFPELTAIPDEAKAFVDEYLKRGHPFKGFGESFRPYDGIKTVAAAIEMAGSLENDKIREALAKVNIQGLSGPIKFDEFGQSRPTIQAIQVKGGKAHIPDFLK